MLGAAGALTDDGRRRRTDDGLNDGRTTTDDDDDDDDDGRRRMVSVISAVYPSKFGRTETLLFFPGILSMRYIFPDGFQAFRSFI